MQNTISKLIKLSEKSRLLNQHAAAIVKGKEILFMSYNEQNSHAECSVIGKYLRCILQV